MMESRLFPKLFWGVVWAVLLCVFGTGAVPPALAANLVTNGAFTDGNTGFASDYNYTPGDLTGEGDYDVVADAKDDHDFWVNCKDHTTRDGLYFAANGSTNTSLAVWKTTTAIEVDEANTAYRFEAYITKVYAINPASLKFQLGDGTTWVDLGTTASLSGAATPEWVFTFADGKFSKAGNYYVRLLNNNGTADGNDFGIDDIYFGLFSTAPSKDTQPDTSPEEPYNTGDMDSSPIVTTQAVTKIGTTTATGNGNITELGSSNPTQHGVCWSTSTNPTIALDTKTTQGAKDTTGAFTSSITGLSAGTTYYVRAYATNSVGTSYGDQVSFSSVPNPPTATAATSITQTGFSANWNASAGATGYKLDVSTQSDFSSYVSGYEDKDVGAVTTSAVTVLTVGTTYYYLVRAVNSGGTSANSGNISATTLPVPDLTGPATATAGAVSTVFTLTSRDADGDAFNVTSDTVFSLSSNSSGTATFYRDAGGTTVIPEVTISNGSSSATFYYKDSNSGTPTVTATRTSGMDLGSDTLQITVSLSTTTLATSTSVALSFTDFKITVTKIEMYNGTSWVTIFSGTAELDLVNGGTFPGISNLSLPRGTYSQIRVTFRNSLPATGTLNYSGTTYYTTATTFGGETNVASDPTTASGSQTVFTFKISDWGAINAEVTQTFAITPITVGPLTNYQLILRFTISDKLVLKGTADTSSTYYFALSAPTVSIVEP